MVVETPLPRVESGLRGTHSPPNWVLTVDYPPTTTLGTGPVSKPREGVGSSTTVRSVGGFTKRRTGCVDTITSFRDVTCGARGYGTTSYPSRTSSSTRRTRRRDSTFSWSSYGSAPSHRRPDGYTPGVNERVGRSLGPSFYPTVRPNLTPTAGGEPVSTDHVLRLGTSIKISSLSSGFLSGKSRIPDPESLTEVSVSTETCVTDYHPTSTQTVPRTVRLSPGSETTSHRKGAYKSWSHILPPRTRSDLTPPSTNPSTPSSTRPRHPYPSDKVACGR